MTTDPANAVTKDWLRKATRTLFETYPLLAGTRCDGRRKYGRPKHNRRRAVDVGYFRAGDCRRSGGRAKPRQPLL